MATLQTMHVSFPRPMLLLGLLLCLTPVLVSAQTDFPSSPVYNDTWDPTLDIPLSDPRNTPSPVEQVVVCPSDSWGTGYWIIWTTNQTCPSEVHLSLDGASFGLVFRGTASRYSYMDYTSGLIHKANCSGLEHSTQYHFRIQCGDYVHRGNFTTVPSPGSPVKLAILADLGTTTSSVSTLQHLLRTGGQAMLLVGDFSYADGFQPRWDLWQRIMYRTVGHLPLYFTYGNHEVEQEMVPGGIKSPFGFYAADARFSGPAGASSAAYAPGGVPGNAFHSTNVGMAHVVSLNSYYIYAVYSLQWRWLQHDLKSVNRTLTPFVIAMIHSPWYSTYYSHFLEGESMRTSLEPFLRATWLGHGVKPVDIVFHGHVHAYERFDNIYQYRRDPCGPVYITIGDAGNREGVAGVRGKVHFDDPEANSTYPDVFNIAEPSISLFREYTYGHGTLDIINRTTALWTWYRNTEELSPKGSDSVHITSHAERKHCHKYVKGTHPYYSLPFADGTHNSWFPMKAQDGTAFEAISGDQTPSRVEVKQEAEGSTEVLADD